MMKSDNYYELKNKADIKEIGWKFKQISRFLDKKVLDIGCGDGRYLRLSDKWYGIDNDERSEQMNSGRNFKRGDILNIPFEDSSFDAIILSHVIEHVPREKTVDAIKEMRRVLKPGGEIFLYAPNPSSPYWYNAIDHINPVNLDCLCDLFVINGFSIENKGYSLMRFLPYLVQSKIFLIVPHIPSEYYIKVRKK